MYTDSAAYGQQATETRSTEVQTEITELASVSEYLAKCVEDLETKLSPVLAQRADDGGKAQNTPSPIRVPLAATLRTRVEFIEGLRVRVSSMISRLEL